MPRDRRGGIDRQMMYDAAFGEGAFEDRRVAIVPRRRHDTFVAPMLTASGSWHVPECSCGWTGRPYTSKAHAEKAARVHARHGK